MTHSDPIPPPPANRSKQYLGLVLGVGLFGVLAYAWHHFYAHENPVPAGPQTQASEKPTEQIRYPVPTQSASAGVTAPSDVESSDSLLQKELSLLIGNSKLASLLNSDNFIRRVVVAVDNATHPTQLSWDMLPFKPLPSFFIVALRGKETWIAAENARRYEPFAALVRDADPQKWVGIYVRFYPLFQAAYQDLGTRQYFNDRLVEVLDHLLETPAFKEPIAVTRPTKKSSYKFVDPKLENLSAGQKALLRMGYDNAIAIQAKMRQMRTLLIHLEGLNR